MTQRSLTADISAIIATALVVGFTFNAFSGDGVPLIRTAPVKVAVADSEIFSAGAARPAGDAPPGTGPAAAAATAETTGQAVFRVITLAQMQRVAAEGRGMILDARSPAEYEAGHIGGALNMYAVEPESFVERIVDIPRDTLLVIYCSNRHCPYGRDLAEFLGAFGFTNMLLYDDGWDGWAEARLPSVTGPEAR